MMAWASARLRNRLVQTLIAKLTVEALDVGVLDRLAGPNEAELDPTAIGPGVQRAAGEFRTVVADDHLRQADAVRQTVEDTDDAGTGQRAVDFDGWALVAEVVDDVERTEAAAVGQRVGHEVHRPPLTRRRGARQGHPLGGRQPLPGAAADLQAGLAIDPMDSLVIRVETFPGHQDVPPSIAETRSHGGVRLKPRQQIGVVDTTVPLVAPRRRAETDDAAGAAQTRVLRVDQPPPPPRASRRGLPLFSHHRF